MLDAQKISERAAEIFEAGVCCSESIVHTFAEITDPENAIKYTKMSSGFCGGLGAGLMCGVVTGSVCAISLFFGRDDLGELKGIKCSVIAERYVDAFMKEYGELDCAPLKKMTPEGCAQREFCTEIVRKGAYKAAEIINDYQNK